MFSNFVSRPLTSTQAQVLAAQNYLDQARQQRTEQHLEIALTLYDRAKVNFRYIADTCQLFLPLSEVKSALIEARTPRTAEEEALRQRIAEVYFERAEVLEKLGKSDKAHASYKKAQAWGYEGIKPARMSSALPLFSSGNPALAQTDPLNSMSAQQKNTLMDYLFEKALLTLGSLEVSNKRSLFLVYAHDNPAYGQAEANTARYLIDNLSKIEVNLYSDRTPMGQTYSSFPKNLTEDGRLEDILTVQLCLLPTRLRSDVEPVDKVVVCCSEVLGSYLKWPAYDSFYQELRGAYRKDREVYLEDSEQPSTSAIRQVIRTFSQEQTYKVGFHHVLTEMAFLQIRVEQLGDQHGIIPVSLTPNSSKKCLGHFISSTTVRIEDIPRFEAQYPNQSRHWFLFKLIERVLVDSDGIRAFLNKFWQGYNDVISRLQNDSTLSELEFVKLVDGIFDGIRIALHRQLTSTVQQLHQQLRVLHADPRAMLREQYFAALKQEVAFKEALKVYVEPRGKASLQELGTFHLLSQVQAFLNDKQVILLLGDSGAGKTTFNRVLEKRLWDQKKEHDAIPLFISLPGIDKPEHDLIRTALKKRGLSEFQIQTLKKEKQKFVFILDGYDEIRQTQNLYLSNGINQSDGWQGHMVISCRSEYLGQDYRSCFQPNPHLKSKDQSFQKVVIQPFLQEERNQYLEKYVQHNPTDWTVQQYQEALEQPHLQVLVGVPFLLRMLLEALPYLENEGKERSTVQLRIDLYDQFVRRWFERNRQRLGTQDLAGAQRETFRGLCNDGFAQHGIRFVQDLAVHLYTENAGNPMVDYSLPEGEGNWKDAFFGREEKQQLLREAWPLSRSGNQYCFIHTSLLEYFVARSLFESFDACRVPDIRRRGSDASSIYSFENEPILSPKTLRDVSLAQKYWVSDLGVMRWLTERVWQETTFKQQLLAIIEHSKTDAGVRQVAANAMTILVRAGVQFNGADLKGIQIPGADLSQGMFDSAQLQGTDLRKVNLRGSWLREANLNSAQMAAVQFGEWPYLQEESEVWSYAYSPDEGACAVGVESGKISVYQTSNWKKNQTLSGHTNTVWSVVYSPQGDQLASGSSDNTVRLWDVKTGACLHILSGHENYVYSVVYSSQENQLASGSWDNTVRLWDVKTGACLRILSGHKNYVYSVVYSPQENRFASGSSDNTVRLWDVEIGSCLHILSEHTDCVTSVAYSPQGDQLASGSKDNTMRLWDVKTGALLYTLSDHTSPVTSVVFSPSGQQVASCSEDNTVRVWDVSSGQCQAKIQDFSGAVRSIAWKRILDRDYLVTGCADKSVRQWEVRKEGEEYKVVLCWSSAHEILTVMDTFIEGVRGLSRINKQLLKQRGAVGEPFHA